MYVIIKKDKAEHLKEKLHHIKSAAIEVLDCLEEAAARHHEYSEDSYRDEARRRDSHPYRADMNRDYPEHDDYYRDMTRRGRGRY